MAQAGCTLFPQGVIPPHHAGLSRAQQPLGAGGGGQAQHPALTGFSKEGENGLAGLEHSSWLCAAMGAPGIRGKRLQGAGLWELRFPWLYKETQGGGQEIVVRSERGGL